MKKQLLLGAFLLGSFFTANAQGTCATAVDVSAGGTFTSAAITGTYEPSCWGGTQTNTTPPGTLMANWYLYTPTANGLLTISSDLAINDGVTNSNDTRVSIFTGICDNLTCYNGSDDVSSTNYLTTITIPVEMGVSYYIAWDNVWVATGFDFTLTFAGNDCLSPNNLSVNAPTEVTIDSATFSWETAIGAPAGYDVKVGTVGFDPETAGTLASTTTTSVSISDLPDSATQDFYVRSNCGASQGSWVGPFQLKLAVVAPYSNNFDTANDNADGFTFSGWNLSTSAQNAALAHSGSAFIFSNVNTAAASDAYAFFRAVSLSQNDQVTINFQSLMLPAASAGTLEITVGAEPNAAAQTTVVSSYTLPGAAGSAANYVARTAVWTAPADGVYYFAFHNNSPIAPAAGSMLIDTMSLEAEQLSTNNFLASQFSVYPNPATNVINITNADNILVNGVTIVDINGRTVKSLTFDNVTEAQINVADLSAGVYLMNISSDNGTTTKKIVKN